MSSDFGLIYFGFNLYKMCPELCQGNLNHHFLEQSLRFFDLAYNFVSRVEEYNYFDTLRNLFSKRFGKRV